MKKKVLFYSLYERIWHWLQALLVIVLLITGFEISYAAYFSVSGFKTAVLVHNIVGIFLVLNAFLALFYNIAGGLIHRYIPAIEEIFSLGFKHVSYYIFGIFKGLPHPFDKTPEKRLLPLQKITYFVILNLILPVMIVTGLLKYSADIFPQLVEMFGGLSVLGPIHRFGAWLFAAFLVLHVYMITTGHTPLANLISMITGYDYVSSPSEEDN
ncbi:MAG: cytochrome b/b6 domain-containing protein [Deltaproteobacteria bacterium]|nr:cytochrome b/b6 domain-containing protein [Deltaproteobacteria bacterium]